MEVADAHHRRPGVRGEDVSRLFPGTCAHMHELMRGASIRRMPEDQILRDFPSLAREDIKAALEFAAARERKLAGSTAG